jgi:NAD(P)H-nitrite reductase large subunit
MKSSSVEIWLRITTNKEYVKLVVHRNRIVGALLIGETELEEVVENLILNKTDVSSYGIDILNPDFEIDDYFD